MDQLGVEMAIFDTYLNLQKRLEEHECVCLGVSGGSDSNIIVHMLAEHFPQYLSKVHFVFQNTGLEYRATLRHLEYMEKRYGIHIDRIRGESVVSVVRREGIPVLSKDYSNIMKYALKGSEWALHRIERTRAESTYAFSQPKRDMAHYIMEHAIPVSYECCNLSKKKPFHKYLKEIHADLSLSGERQCEGGQRATRHKGCFEKRKDVDKYMPLWWWDDATKEYYKRREGIRYSDCYEVWGMTRTGCVGCPYNSKVADDLKRIKQYEPGLYKACIHVFGESYLLMDQFDVHRHKMFTEEERQEIKEMLQGKSKDKKGNTNA